MKGSFKASAFLTLVDLRKRKESGLQLACIAGLAVHDIRVCAGSAAVTVRNVVRRLRVNSFVRISLLCQQGGE